MQAEHIGVIILAAGQSRRFGSSKMRHIQSNGKTILRSCVESYQHVFSNVTVVVSDDVHLHKGATELGVNVVVSQGSIEGMSQSLIAGIQSQPNVGAWLIALGDMPYIKSETLNRLKFSATKNNIVVPVCDDQRGNPVIFGREFGNQLLSLKGDIGGKPLVNSNSASLLEVLVSDTGVLHDIDRLEDVCQ